MKFLWYEDITKDLMKTIREVSKFIGYRMTEYKILKLDDHLHIDNFRKIMLAANGGDAKMANFIRKGKVGDWKNYLNEESTVKIWDEWIPENLQGTDIVLPES